MRLAQQPTRRRPRPVIYGGTHPTLSKVLKSIDYDAQELFVSMREGAELFRKLNDLYDGLEDPDKVEQSIAGKDVGTLVRQLNCFRATVMSGTFPGRFELLVPRWRLVEEA